MAQTANDVVVAQSGALYTAVADTAEPAFLGTPGAPWTDTGLISEDGVTITNGLETTDIQAWQVAGVVRRLVTNEPKELAFTLIQFDPAAFRVAMRGGTFPAGGTYAAGTSPMGGTYPAGTATRYNPPGAGALPVLATYITAWDGTAAFAYYFPRCQVSAEVAFNLQRGAAQELPVTMEVLAASSGTANRFSVQSNHPAWVAAVNT